MIIRITVENMVDSADVQEIYYDTLNHVDDLTHEIRMLFIHLREIKDPAMEDMRQRAKESEA